MKSTFFAQAPARFRWNSCAWIVLAVTGTLALLFYRSFLPGQALFANDGPLGVNNARVYEMPSGFLGLWNDLNWIGLDSGSFPPNFYGMMRYLFGPLGYVNFSPPVSLLVLGLCAGFFFRQLGFCTLACVLGALAAALNGNFFSNACWGLPSRATALGMTFLALAALQSSWERHALVKTILAGLAIGMSISESGDNGAIFSLFVSAFAIFLALNRAEPLLKKATKGFAQVALMAVFAAVLAAQTINMFIGVSGKGAVTTPQETMTPEQRWGWATQWSLPKLETLRVIIPGLFGYRLDTPNGGNYSGHVGRDPAFEKTGQGISRHSGAGEYAGVLVVLVGVWAVAGSLRRKDSPFSETEKKMIWFWSGAGIVALFLAWGRYWPFYAVLYQAPHFSTIRNPMKFMHPFHLCLMILFAYGLQGLWRRYVSVASPLKKQGFEKKWTLASLAAVGVGILSFLVYAASSDSLVRRLMADGFNDPTLARQMAKFSVNEVMFFAFFLIVSVVAVLLIQRGVFSGPKAKWAGVFLGVILVLDLARADAPWIRYYNYREKYATNPVLDALAAKPHEGRVAMALSMCVSPQQFDTIQKIYPFTRSWMLLQQVYQVEWLQHQFPYYNIQSLDQPQEPRPSADKIAYRSALTGKPARLYELMNTRYLCGMAGNFTDALNQIFDPQKRRFRVHTAFNFVQVSEEGIGVQTNPAGQWALIEFTGALPRTKLYSQWQTSTNEQATLDKLADPAFDPAQSVIVANEIASSSPAAAGSPKLSAEIASYAPKRVELKTESPVPSVLLMNNKWDEGWKVKVDGKPAPLLRCNFLMQGVYLPAGSKVVVFSYQPKSTMFFVSSAAVIFGIVLCVFLAVTQVRGRNEPSAPTTSTGPSSPAKRASKPAK